MSSSQTPAVGDLYQRELLQTQAIYRVVAVEDDHVQVEAVDVPGLSSGHSIRLTLDSFGCMTRVAALDGAPNPAAQRPSSTRPAGLAPRLASR
jgi:hypothetical protein